LNKTYIIAQLVRACPDKRKVSVQIYLKLKNCTLLTNL
jgi:hypothetical protein